MTPIKAKHESLDGKITEFEDGSITLILSNGFKLQIDLHERESGMIYFMGVDSAMTLRTLSRGISIIPSASNSFYIHANGPEVI